MFGRGGGGGLDPSKMQQMMEQMGIDIDELDAEEVIIRLPDEELVFTDADVQRMDAQGQETYNVVGSPEHRERGESALESGATAEADDDDDSEDGIPQDDIDFVAAETNTADDEAREALKATDGDLAAAIQRLE